MKPSARIILNALLRGEKLTPLTSLGKYGVHALSQRCGELRREYGYHVVSRRVKGDVYHEYFIP